MKFKYNDYVKIKTGFYAGVVNQVKNVLEEGVMETTTTYKVDIPDGGYTWIEEANLELFEFKGE